MRSVFRRLQTYLYCHPRTVLTLTLALVTVAALSGAAAGAESAVIDTTDLTVNTTDGGVGSTGPPDP
jgi:hypothetical protein